MNAGRLQGLDIRTKGVGTDALIESRLKAPGVVDHIRSVIGGRIAIRVDNPLEGKVNHGIIGIPHRRKNLGSDPLRVRGDADVVTTEGTTDHQRSHGGAVAINVGGAERRRVRIEPAVTATPPARRQIGMSDIDPAIKTRHHHATTAKAGGPERLNANGGQIVGRGGGHSEGHRRRPRYLTVEFNSGNAGPCGQSRHQGRRHLHCQSVDQPEFARRCPLLTQEILQRPLAAAGVLAQSPYQFGTSGSAITAVRKRLHVEAVCEMDDDRHPIVQSRGSHALLQFRTNDCSLGCAAVQEQNAGQGADHEENKDAMHAIIRPLNV